MNIYLYYETVIKPILPCENKMDSNKKNEVNDGAVRDAGHEKGLLIKL